MSLQTAVISTLTKVVFEPLHKHGSWKILILDDRATQILTSVLRMRDLMKYGISCAESLYRARQRFKSVIYIITPNRREVDLLINDFSPECVKYLEAHVFFLYECPREVLLMLAASNAMCYVKTLSQLDLDFIPIESSFFSFESRETSHLYALPPSTDQERQTRLNQLAQQLATVCVTLQEYPKICYHKNESNKELASLLQTKLDECLENNPNMGRGLHKDRSILLILDRGFDLVSPILHELTLQAACYDLLPVENHMVTYEENRKANVTDEDPLWREFRHQHIAHASTKLKTRIEEFAQSKKRLVAAQGLLRKTSPDGGSTNEGFVADSDESKSKELDLREMSNLLKEMPQYQAEAARYTAVFNILQSCMNIVRDKVADLCHAEQDLAMGQNSKGEPLIEPMRILSDVLKHNTGSADDRLRLVMLFVLTKDGTAENHLEKLLSVAGVDGLNKMLFASLSLLLGAQLIIPDPVGLPSGTLLDANVASVRLAQFACLKNLPSLSAVSNYVQAFLPAKGKRKDRVDSNCFTVSRWTPYLLDVLENAIAGTLDSGHFIFHMGMRNRPKHDSLAKSDGTLTRQTPRGPSARFQPAAHQPIARNLTAQASQPPTSSLRGQPASSEHCGPRVIVFIVGGATWSEVRTAYELTEKCIETRLAESDRHSVLRGGARLGSTTLPGGGGSGWNWEIVIGGTHVLTPEAFIGDLQSISHLAIGSLPSSELFSSDHGPRKSSFVKLPFASRKSH